MSGTVLTWIAANKEWCFGAICSVTGGIFAFVKWILPLRRRHSMEPKEAPGPVSDAGPVTMRIDGRVTGGVIAGSNNVQTVVVNQNLPAVRTPIKDRKPSSPTANEIRQRQSSALDGIPLYLRSETQKRLLDSNLGLSMEWPVRVNGVWKTYSESEGGLLTVHARFGDESWGAFIKFEVKENRYPILKTLRDGHMAFVQGRIIAIDDHIIEIGVARLDFE